GHPHHYVGILAPAVVAFGQVIHNLVEAAGHEISELHLHHRLFASDAEAQPRAHDGRLAERCVAHPPLAKLLHEALAFFYLRLNAFARLDAGRFADDALGQQPLFVVLDRVFGGPLLHQLGGHVLGAAGFFVAAHPEGPRESRPRWPRHRPSRRASRGAPRRASRPARCHRPRPTAARGAKSCPRCGARWVGAVWVSIRNGEAVAGGKGSGQDSAAGVASLGGEVVNTALFGISSSKHAQKQAILPAYAETFIAKKHLAAGVPTAGPKPGNSAARTSPGAAVTAARQCAAAGAACPGAQPHPGCGNASNALLRGAGRAARGAPARGRRAGRQSAAAVPAR
nr:hypothetical protein [Tanacetum cinerariifolium]